MTTSRGAAAEAGDGTVTTPRLDLPPLQWESVRAILDGRRRAEWAPDYPAEGDRFIAGGFERGGRGEGGEGSARWGHRQVVVRASGLVVGGIGFHRPPGRGAVELGYGIVPSHRGRGYATEAVAAMVALAWSDPDVHTVTAHTDEDNLASQRVLEKAEFGRVPSDRGVSFARERTSQSA